MAHTSMAVLQYTFPNCLISRIGDLTWPSHSPDLTASDYLLWVYLKESLCPSFADDWQIGRLSSAVKYMIIHRTCRDVSWKPSRIALNTASKQEEDISRTLFSSCVDVCIVYCAYVYTFSS
jgi:hypothetical protein